MHTKLNIEKFVSALEEAWQSHKITTTVSS